MSQNNKNAPRGRRFDSERNANSFSEAVGVTLPENDWIMERREGESVYDWIDRQNKWLEEFDSRKDKLKKTKHTHTYTSIGGLIVKCFILEKRGWFKVLVYNENGSNVILKKWHLTKIKK